MLNVHLADGTLRKPETNPRPVPPPGQNRLTAVEVKHVATVQLNGRSRREGLSEANHTHVVRVLRQLRLLRSAATAGLTLGRETLLLQTWQTLFLVDDSTAQMATRMDFRTSICRVLLALLVHANISHRQQTGAASHSAKPAHANRGVWRITNQRVVSIAKFEHSLERFRVDKRQQPKQLGPATAFVQLDPNGLLFLFANLKVESRNREGKREDATGRRSYRAIMISGLSVQVQKPVTIGAQRTAQTADDHGVRNIIVVI